MSVKQEDRVKKNKTPFDDDKNTSNQVGSKHKSQARSGEEQKIDFFPFCNIRLLGTKCKKVVKINTGYSGLPELTSLLSFFYITKNQERHKNITDLGGKPKLLYSHKKI